MRFAPLLALVLASGCVVHRVRVESEPPGAVVKLDGKVKGVTPLEFNTVWTPPFSKKYEVRVTLPGYRPVASVKPSWWQASPLRRDVRLWRYALHLLRWRMIVGVAPRTTLNYVLVPEHGPSGTWTPEDVP
ncbi:MAG: PEGA domain-containing protein [Alphaproteobacteria bacterium]|nr:PEGA domain-containing protein [Alphaproteobacteria bacterium]